MRIERPNRAARRRTHGKRSPGCPRSTSVGHGARPHQPAGPLAAGDAEHRVRNDPGVPHRHGAYFRKMFGPPGIERLDVGLIDPDKTSELPSLATAHQEFQTIVETPEGIRPA